MSTTSSMTADQLLELPDDGNRYELVAGELRMMSPGKLEHGRITMLVGQRIANFVEKHGLGVTYGAETGFLISRNPDTVRAPDVAYLAKENVPAELPERGYWHGVPDLAVEVLSPNDRTAEVQEKIADWLDAGCRMVWVVDPKARTIAIHCSDVEVDVRTFDDEVDGGQVLPGFRCRVAEMFGEKREQPEG